MLHTAESSFCISTHLHVLIILMYKDTVADMKDWFYLNSLCAAGVGAGQMFRSAAAGSDGLLL